MRAHTSLVSSTVLLAGWLHSSSQPPQSLSFSSVKWSQYKWRPCLHQEAYRLSHHQGIRKALAAPFSLQKSELFTTCHEDQRTSYACHPTEMYILERAPEGSPGVYKLFSKTVMEEEDGSKGAETRAAPNRWQ